MIDKQALADLKELVDRQVRDEGLWFMAQYCSEGYLQRELRRLHEACERLWREPKDGAHS